MPRQTSEPTKATAPLVASAVSYPGKGRSRSAAKAGTAEGFQKEAWGFYDKVGELRYGSNWVANVASQALLYAGKRDRTNNIVRSDDSSKEAQTLSRFFGGSEGQTAFLRAATLHMTVAGEVYAIMRYPFEDEEDLEGKHVDDDGIIYEVLGTEEISYSGDTWYVLQPDGKKAALSDIDTVTRIWLPHPRDRSKADSPVRGVLGALAEICLYDAHIKAQATSRLTGGGVFVIPSEMQLTPPKEMADAYGDQDPTTADTFVWNLLTAMETARQSNGEPASVAPAVVTGPGEHIGNIQHFKFWSDLDEKVIEMRQDAIVRVARGMDLPPEIFLGTGEMNRWGAWQVEESSIKAHVEPVLNLITNTLTVEYLKPISDLKDVVIGVDTSKLRLRPNRSKEAVELYDRGVLNREALVRETGFGEEDISDQRELRQWILLQMVRASWSPEQAQEAAKMLGVELTTPTKDDKAREARPVPSLEDHPSRDRPKVSRSDPDWEPQPHEDPAAAAAAITVLAHRAMERAGNRLKSLSGMKPEGVKSSDVHLLITPYADRLDDLLKDAWDLSFVGHVDEGQAKTLVAEADSYCRDLLLHKRPFSHADLQSRLRAGL